MASDLLEVIIKAIDQASGPAKSVDNAFDKLGNTATNSNQKMGQASQMTEQKMQQLKTSISDVSASTASATSKGASQFKWYNSSVQDSIIKFNTLDDETQEWLNRLNNAHNPQVFYELNSKCQEAVSKFQQLDSLTDTWSGSLDYARSKLELMGNSTETLKGKAQTVGTAIQTYVGNKWDNIKGKVSSFGSFIKSNLSSALSTVRSKIQSLGNAFTGLGGIMSSVMGGIGLKSMADMTVGASINRDRIFNLSYAVLGAGKSMDYFKNSSSSLWNQMDADTNRSLVGLDQISQAMSVINMSANASESQLKALEPVILDIGQRAILMGKDGEEAVGLMQAAGKGLNGEFEMLRENFGITKDKLEAAGWSGAADDIDGYTKALDTCLKASGDVSDMMNTTSGKLTVLNKYWGLAGRSLGDEFLPYVDQALTKLVQFLDADRDGALDARGKKWLQYGYGVMAVASGFATVAPSIAPALSVLDTMAGKTKSALQFLGLMKAEEDALTLATLRESAAQKISAATKYIAGVATTVYGGIMSVLSGEITLVAAATAVWNAILAANPIMLVVIALAALAVAVYEVGKYFGYWDDVGQMLQVLWAGVQRLWNAFINHPDVQATIKAIGDAFNWICGAIGNTIDWIASFFNISTNGDFDVVAAAITGISLVWEVLKHRIMAVVTIVQLVASAFSAFYNGALIPLGSYIMEILTPAFTWLSELWASLVEVVQPLVDVFTQFKTGQTDLLSVITAVGSTLWNVWTTLTSALTGLILQLVANLLTWAIQAGLNFLNGISLYLSQVAGRVRAYLMNTLTNIISVATRWVNTGRQKASQFLNGVISFFRQLPGRALSILLSVVSSIISAGSQWVSNAKNKASSVVTGVVGILQGLPGNISSALSGVISAITSPFSTAYSKVCDIVDNIKSKVNDAMNYIGGLGGAAGGDLAAGGDSPSVRDFNIFTGEYNTANSGTEKIEVEETLTIILDFINVPSDIDTDLLIRSLNDPKVLSALVSNPKFQDLDAKIKAKIDGKYRRSVGG